MNHKCDIEVPWKQGDDDSQLLCGTGYTIFLKQIASKMILDNVSDK